MAGKGRPSPQSQAVHMAQAMYPKVLASVTAYLSSTEKPNPSQTRIAGNPTASELLARGYPQYIAESVARDQEEPV